MHPAIDSFCLDARQMLSSEPNAAGREKVRQRLERLLQDQSFLAAYCSGDAAPGIQTIFQDQDTGFNLLVHVYDQGKAGPPHDHGASWAIYGQAAGHTIMTTWARLDEGGSQGPARLEKTGAYRLDPGMAGIFEPRDVHSIEISDGSRFVRVTGTDLNAIETLVFNPEAGTVKPGNRL